MLTVIQILATIFYVTWILWPFAFVFGLAHGIKSLLNSEKLWNAGLVIAAISLVFMLAGLLYPCFA